ncbi:TPA: agmatine deiminase [Legionella pneumophila subsp. pneumophila]|nr:agmatine deiminase [Legionella pneumophila]HAT9244036.1 agmatine deiminase [Legionella pneumophila subsp. pneumophila]HAT9449526.1 agmatine deiminase [Legionella pneumophila subsp. pneumophila]HAT9452756.1 agmatine deiminase [Legionella pneumophila subsp. pneumophila]HAT9456013.1 agmatine deiminase [Legionella pneumophila subsp. pneumophila]
MNMNTAPKQYGFYMPAEWYPHERCWMAWPCHHDTWSKIGLDKAKMAYARVAKAIAQFEPVTLLVNPGDEDSAENLCKGHNIEIISLPINDSWTRDTGATFLINNERQLAGVDWIHNAWGGNYADCSLDNLLASHLIKYTEAQYFHAPLVMEGGSFHVDGEGTILTSKECLLNSNRNPHLSQQEIEQYLINFLGAERIIWLNMGLIGDETDGHVDEIATFIAPGKVLCLITKDKEDPNYHRLQENFEILKSSKDARGRTFEVYTVEQPPATYLNGERLTLSYINFYMANQGIVMPAFGYESFDRLAYQLFVQIFPGYQITQIDALDVFSGGGGIHCITQQQPKSYKLVG